MPENVNNYPGCGIITDLNEIKKIIDCKSFDKDKFNGWEYDLCLGDEYYTTTEDVPKILDDGDPYAIIKPGEFGLLITKETLAMKENMMAFISVKFTYKQKGLINISGFHVDPQYNGKIIFSVYNAGPNDIVLKYGEPVFMIFFQWLVPSKDHVDKKPSKKFDSIPVDMVSAIRGRSVSLATNANRIEKLEFYFKFYGAIAVSIIIVLLGIIVRGLVSA